MGGIELILTLETMCEVGPMLKSARLKQGWTMRDLEERTNIAPSTICHIENGEFFPRLDTLAVLGDALGFRTEFAEVAG